MKQGVSISGNFWLPEQSGLKNSADNEDLSSARSTIHSLSLRNIHGSNLESKQENVNEYFQEQEPMGVLSA
jgi:hypothetical protein